MTFLDFLNFWGSAIKATLHYITISQDLLISHYFRQINGEVATLEKFLSKDNTFRCLDLNATSNEGYHINISNYIMEGQVIDHKIYKQDKFGEDYLINEYLWYYIQSTKQKNFTDYFSDFLFFIEIFLIFLQKLYFEYYNFLLNNFYWYDNSRLLTDKSILKLLDKDEINYHISLDLLLDIQDEYFKNLTFMLQNFEKLAGINIPANYKRSLLKKLYENYMHEFKDNPYRIMKKLKILYKKYPRSTLLTYGIDYDNIDIRKHDILGRLLQNTNLPYVNYKNKSGLQEIEIIQFFLKNNILERKPIHFEYIKNDEMVYNSIHDYTSHNSTHRWYIFDWFHKASGSELFTEENLEKKKWGIINFKWHDEFFYTWRFNLFRNLVEDPFSFWNKGHSFSRNFPLEMQRRAYGGYTYWWSWHQDAFYLYGDKGSGGVPHWITLSKKFTKRLKPFTWAYQVTRYRTRMRQFLSRRVRVGNWLFKRYGWFLKRYSKVQKFAKWYLYHGRTLLKLEKAAFHDFLISRDFWTINSNTTAQEIGYSNRDRWTIIRHIHRKYWRLRYYFKYTSLLETLQDHFLHVKFKWNLPHLKKGKRGFIMTKGKRLIIFGAEIEYERPKKIKVRRHPPLRKRWFFSTNYEYNAGSQHGLYVKKKSLFKRILTRYANCSRKGNLIYNKAFTHIRGTLMRDYTLDYWFDKNELLVKKKIRYNKIFADNSLLAIENLKEDWNLSYIQRNFYSRHILRQSEFLLGKKSELYSKVKLPKSKNVLIRKMYIENLTHAYDNEETSIIRYVKYKNNFNFIDFWWNLKVKEQTSNIWNFVYDLSLEFRSAYINLLKIFVNESLNKLVLIWKIKTINTVYNNFEWVFREYHEYFWKFLIVSFVGLFYSVVSGLLILLIKSYLPKNLIYGISAKKEISFFKKLNNFLFKGKPSGSLELKKSYYIYAWQKNDSDSKQLKENTELKQIKKGYTIYYKRFLFEKSVDKWENTTKLRMSLIFLGEYFGVSVLGILRGLLSDYKDKRFNHNRKIIWADTSLDKECRVIFFYNLPKFFFNIFFIFRFLGNIFKLWDYRFWWKKIVELAVYNIHARLDYTQIKKDLEKEWTLEWYKDNLDYGVGMLYTDWKIVKEKVNSIKNKISINEETKPYRVLLLSDIVTMDFNKKKLLKIAEFKTNIKNARKTRSLTDLDLRYENIREKLPFEVSKITDKEWAEQQVMYQYRNLIYEQKIKLDNAAYEHRSKYYQKRRAKDFDDNSNTLKYIDFYTKENIEIKKDARFWSIKYEKLLREKNFKARIIDKALDKKDKSFFEHIPQYNRDLERVLLQVEENEKQRDMNKTDYEKFGKLLYNDLEKNYIGFRWFTTMGSRLSYIFTLFISLFTIWTEHVQKIRRNDYSVEGLVWVFKKEGSEYIYRKYWEYIIIWERYETFKKLGYNIKDILKFSLFFVTPLWFLTSSLYLPLILYVLVKIKIIDKVVDNTVIKKIKKNVNRSLNVLSFFFKDIKTGETLFEMIYINIYTLCSWIQNNMYYITGAFILGYQENGVTSGIWKVLTLLKYKFQVYIKIMKQRNKTYTINDCVKLIKLFFFIKKEGISLKLKLFVIMFDIKQKWIKVHWSIFLRIYKWLIRPVFRITYVNFYNLYKSLLLVIRKTYASTLFGKIQTVSWKNIIVIMFKFFIGIVLSLKVLIADVIFIIKKFIKNMINVRFIKDSWQEKVHLFVIEARLSTYLRTIKTWDGSPIEHFILYKGKERPNEKNEYQKKFWKKLFWDFKIFQRDFFDWLIDVVEKTETAYIEWNEDSTASRFSIKKNIKNTMLIYQLRRSGDHRFKYAQNQRNMSRDVFFAKKSLGRKYLVFKFFLKGVINWITYITIKQVFFKNIKELKHKKIKVKKGKYKYIRYNVSNIGENYHLGTHLLYVPPQFWSLVILYEIYCKQVLSYFYDQKKYPISFNNELSQSRDMKWRVASPLKQGTRFRFEPKSLFCLWRALFNLEDIAEHVEQDPYDPMFRWVMFLLEFGLTYEEYDESGKETWADIGMAHLLTYNSGLEELQYEIKAFSREIRTYLTILRYGERNYEEDKLKYFNTRSAWLSTYLMNKNEGLMQDVLQERRARSAKLLDNALKHYVLKTPEQQEAEFLDAQSRDLFHFKKRQFFYESDVENYLDWKGEFDGRIVEEQYYNPEDLIFLKKKADIRYKLAEYQPTEVDPLDYLENSLLLLSFDETLEDLTHFIKFELWNILQNKLKKEKGIINFKQIRATTPNILRHINYQSHKKKFTVEEFIIKYKKENYSEVKSFNDILNEEEVFTKPGVRPLIWEFDVQNTLTKISDNNILGLYFVLGEIFTYADKVQYMSEVSDNFKLRKNYYHKHKVLFQWICSIEDRSLNLKNINKISKINTRYVDYIDTFKGGYSLIYINNIRWSWAQWVGYENIEEESKIMNKNLIIFNEKLRLWNLKRGPIRVKLPIFLKVRSKKTMAYFRNKKGSTLTDDEARYYFFSAALEGILLDCLNWVLWKENTESIYKKNIVDFLFWVLLDYEDKEAAYIRRTKPTVIPELIQNFRIFNNLYFVGYPQYSWELLRYHDLFLSRDDFPFQEYFLMKQSEYLAHDPLVTKKMAWFENIALTKYKPRSYYFFYKRGYFRNSYIIFSVFMYYSIFRLFDVLFYYAGHYVYDMWTLIWPFILIFIFWHARKKINDQREKRAGRDLYLYEAQSFKLESVSHLKRYTQRYAEEERRYWEGEVHWRLEESENITATKIDLTEDDKEHMTTDLYNMLRVRNWWQMYTHLSPENKTYSYKKHVKLLLLMLMAVTGVFVVSENFRYRNEPCFWSSYRFDQKMFVEFIEFTSFNEQTYKTRYWGKDSWQRFEDGGNLYSQWYTNIFRILQKRTPIDLDYGHDSQKIKNIRFTMKYREIAVIKGRLSYADLSWFDLTLEMLKKVPETIIEVDDYTLEYKPKIGQAVAPLHERSKRLNYLDWSEWKDYELLVTFWQKLLDRYESVMKKSEFKQMLRHYVFIRKYRYRAWKIRRNPIAIWRKFHERMRRLCDYDVENDHITFLSRAKEKTRNIIRGELESYHNFVERNNAFEKKKKLIFKKISWNMEDLTLSQWFKDKAVKPHDINLDVTTLYFLKYKVQRLTNYASSLPREVYTPLWKKIIRRFLPFKQHGHYQRIEDTNTTLWIKGSKADFKAEYYKKLYLKYAGYINKNYKFYQNDFYNSQFIYKFKVLLQIFKDKEIKWSKLNEIMFNYYTSNDRWGKFLEFYEIVKSVWPYIFK